MPVALRDLRKQGRYSSRASECRLLVVIHTPLFDFRVLQEGKRLFSSLKRLLPLDHMKNGIPLLRSVFPPYTKSRFMASYSSLLISPRAYRYGRMSRAESDRGSFPWLISQRMPKTRPTMIRPP